MITDTAVTEMMSLMRSSIETSARTKKQNDEPGSDTEYVPNFTICSLCSVSTRGTEIMFFLYKNFRNLLLVN